MNHVKASNRCDHHSCSSANTTDENKVRKCGSRLSQWALEIHWNKWYLHEISNDPSNTLGREHTAMPCLWPWQLWVHACHSPCHLRWLGQSWGTHLHLPLGQPLLSGPLANVIRVTSLEGYSGHGPLTKADLPTNSPSQPAPTSLFKVLKKQKKLATSFWFVLFDFLSWGSSQICGKSVHPISHQRLWLTSE